MSVTETLTSTQSWTAPVGVVSVAIECWGAGASGAANGVGGTNDTATGGGAGAYSKKNSFAVTPGNSYTATVGVGGASVSSAGRADGNDGNDTWFNSTGTVLAKGGLKGTAAISTNAVSGGLGGQTAAGVGDTKYKGGQGGDHTAFAGVDCGTGGGGSAGDATDGGNAAAVGAGSGTGGAAGTVGGVAGTNGNNSGNTTAGTQPGAGSGGARSPGGTAVSGKGGDGQIKLTYATVLTTTVSDTAGTTEINATRAQYNPVLTDSVSMSEVVTALRNIWSDLAKATSTFVNTSKTYLFTGGSPLGLLLALTQATSITSIWSDQSKNTSTFNNQSKS